MPAKNFVIPAGVLCNGRPYGQRLTKAPIPTMAMDAASPRIAGLPQPGNNADDDDPDSVVSKLKAYLGDILTPEQMQDVATILGGDDPDTAPAVAMDEITALERRARHLRAVAAQRAPEALKRYRERFPDSARLVRW